MKKRQIYGNGSVPNGWRTIPLGDLVNVNSRNWDPSDGSQILYLDLTSVIEPGRLAAPREIAAPEAPSRARRRVQSGDVLVSTVRPNLRGFARVRQSANNLIASTGFAVLSPLDEVDGSFIYHHIMTEQFAGYLENAATGQAYPAVRPGEIKSYPLLLPPRYERRSIGAVLDAIDEAIEETEAVITNSESLSDALLQELLTRGIPGWHGEWTNAPSIGHIPAEWEVVRLGEICEKPAYGATASAQPYDPERPRYVRITDLTDDGRLREDDLRSADPKQAVGYELLDGDLLFARSGATVGKTYLHRNADGQCVYAGYLIRFRPVTGRVLPEYLELVTHSQRYRAWIASMLRAGAQPNINAEEYSSMPVQLPPLQEQREITALMNGVRGTLEEALTERTGLQSLLVTTSDALLSGRTRTTQAVCETPMGVFK